MGGGWEESKVTWGLERVKGHMQWNNMEGETHLFLGYVESLASVYECMVRLIQERVCTNT